MVRAKKSILIVDDVTTNLKCLGEICKDFYSVSMAKSGEQALSLMKKVHPNLVLLDVKMPGMDGFETMQKMFEQPEYADIPVIVLSADADESSKERSLAIGAKDYITKPYEPEVLLDKIAANIK